MKLCVCSWAVVPCLARLVLVLLNRNEILWLRVRTHYSIYNIWYIYVLITGFAYMELCVCSSAVGPCLYRLVFALLTLMEDVGLECAH